MFSLLKYPAHIYSGSINTLQIVYARNRGGQQGYSAASLATSEPRLSSAILTFRTSIISTALLKTNSPPNVLRMQLEKPMPGIMKSVSKY